MLSLALESCPHMAKEAANLQKVGCVGLDFQESGRGKMHKNDTFYLKHY